MLNTKTDYGRSVIELLARFRLNKKSGMNADNRKHPYHHFSFVKIGATRPYDD